MPGVNCGIILCGHFRKVKKICPFRIWRATMQRPARERHKIHIASRENVDNQAPRNTNLHISMFQFTFKCGYNDFISKYTDINNLHVTQINLLHNDDTFCST